MLFNTAQQDFLQTLVPTMRERGYSYYVAYSNYRDKESAFGSYLPDLYVVFSKEAISSNNGYTYKVPAGSVRYSCRTVNYSSSSHAVNTERIVSEPFSGSLSVPEYEFIYTNSENASTTVQPDILGGERANNENYMQATVFLLSVFLIFTVLWKIFGKIK